jgi:hypothetical protein
MNSSQASEQMIRNEDLAVALANLKGSKHKDLMATAEALQRLKVELRSNQAVGQAVGVSGEIVRQFLSLLRLPEEVRGLIEGRHIGLEQGRQLYKIARRRPEILDEIALAMRGMTAHDARQLVVFLLQHPELSTAAAKQTVLGAKSVKRREFHVIAVLDDEAFQKLKRQAKKRRKAVDEVVTDIVQEWLSGRD